MTATTSVSATHRIAVIDPDGPPIDATWRTA